jgi:CHAT domain-containing protein/tetratricopeptide (TPR) repeat protein
VKFEMVITRLATLVTAAIPRLDRSLKLFALLVAAFVAGDPGIAVGRGLSLAQADSQIVSEFRHWVDRWLKTDDREVEIASIGMILRLEPKIVSWPTDLPIRGTRNHFIGFVLFSLGDSYNNRTQGVRADNLERAIEVSELALAIFTREGPSPDWALTQYNLAVFYWDRLNGNRADNLERSLKFLDSTFTVLTPTAFPEWWAQAQHELGVVYMDRSVGERAENIERAISAYRAALTIRTQSKFPERWATTLNMLSGALRERINGNKADNLEEALESAQGALTVYSREKSPDLWAGAQYNLANAYFRRIRGNSANNLEMSIASFESVLTIWTREKNQRLWAQAEATMGLGYYNRTLGDRADNLEHAIRAYQAALEVFTPDGSAEQWGDVQNNLGIALVMRIKGDRAENLELALKAFEAALAVRDKVAAAKDWADTQSNLGAAYRNRIRGDRAENIERAIAAYQASLTVRTQKAYAEDWAATENNLALAYANRLRGEPADNLELAITGYTTVLNAITRDALPALWSMVQNNLCIAYADRIKGERADNVERAIEACQSALTVRESGPDFAQTQNNLGLAYADRIRGERRQNLELAVKAYEAALQVRTPQDFPQDWATTQNNLGVAYRELARGDQAEENLAHAIGAFEAALTVFNRDGFPEDWAKAQLNLANAYADDFGSERPQSLERAIAAYQASLTVTTQNIFPQAWAGGMNNLGSAYLYRIRGDRADNVEQAIHDFEAALTVRKRDTVPEAWAATMLNLGTAYASRIVAAKPDNLRRATEAYEAALTVFTRDALPRSHLGTSRMLVQAFLQMGNWAAARDAFVSARDAFLILFGQGLDETEARDLIEEAGPLFGEASYAVAQLGDTAAALSILNEGKARLMAVALRQQRLELTPDKQARYKELKSEIRELSRTAETGEGVTGAQALQQLVVLRRELGQLLQEGLAKETPEGTMAIARMVTPEGGVLVAPIVTKVGGKILIVTTTNDVGVITTLDLPELSTERLNKLFRGSDEDGGAIGGWLRAFNIQYLKSPEKWKRWPEWISAIEKIGPDLWRLFASELDKELVARGVRPGARMVVLPTGALGLLPLGLAQDPDSGRRLGETYEIVQAPSLEALAAAAERTRTPAAPTLAIAINPTGLIPDLALPFTETEGAMVKSHFESAAAIVLDKSTATPEAVLNALKGKSYWHFSSHGFFDWNDARGSGLLMKDEQKLTVGHLLEEQQALGSPRLVVLSACETGLYEVFRNPDEFVGLPETFIQLGAAGVVSALWQVDDAATALLMAKFYDLHMGHGVNPPAALRAAQAWLRSSTRADLIAYGQAAVRAGQLTEAKFAELESMMRGTKRAADSRFALAWNNLQSRATTSAHNDGTTDLLSKPFAHPYYWGAFVYTGL